jgi:beta-phosphoglucomutase
MKKFSGAIFDLDGVLVDTAKYHYFAWRRLAERLGFIFTPEQNEQLKGVSRMKSLDILLKTGGMQGRFTKPEKETMAEWKNNLYIKEISKMDSSDLLNGALPLLQKLKKSGIKTAIGSSSRNAKLVLQVTGIVPYFDAVIDGDKVTRAKPDPQIFLLSASALSLPPEDCTVFEDSQSGLAAAKAAGIYAIGIGKPNLLSNADTVYPDLSAAEIPLYFGLEG